MNTTTKIVKIEKLLESLKQLEVLEKSMFDLAALAITNEKKKFEITINTFELKSKEVPETVIFEIFKTEIKNLKKPDNSRKNEKHLFLELEDTELLPFLGLYQNLIVTKKQKVTNSLKRLGVKI